jgi:predicted membrane-bound spermidine synthase
MQRVPDRKTASVSAFSRGIMSAVALFVFTFCGLALEVALIRLYSVIFLQGYVYLLISLSVAGLGFGAVWVYFATETMQRLFFRSLSAVAVLAFFAIVAVNFLSVHFLFSLFPTLLLFACIGAAVTVLFQKSTLPIPLLYGTDLCGAALGAVSSYYLLNAFGAVKVIVILLMCVALSSLVVTYLFYGPARHWILVCLLTAALSIGLFFLDLPHLVSPRHNRLKDMSTVLADKKNNPRIVATRWTAFGRSDLVETDNPLFKTLYIDGAAGTKMLRLENGVIDPALERALRYEYVGGIPLLTIPEKRRNHAVVIGSGGGIDVVTLLAADYKRITAVEINSDFIEMVRNHGAYNGDIYNGHSNVEVVNREGRAYIRSSNKRFDMIHMSLPIIKSARNIGSYALIENHLFTYEAFKEYLEALDPEGYLIVVAHYTGEAYRLVANIVKAFELESIPAQAAMKHIVLIGRDSSPALIFRKNAFTEEDAEAYYGMIRTLG